MSDSENLTAAASRPRPRARAKVKISAIQGNVVSFCSPDPTDPTWRKQLKTSLGTVSEAFVDMALHHLERAARMPGAGPSDMSINGALAIIAAFDPQNEAEAALALQAACTHMVTMVMMARIGGGHGFDGRLPALASATAKLVRAYCIAVETNRRLRHGGEQKITVQHQYVTVNGGGQAVVGLVNSRASEVER